MVTERSTPRQSGRVEGSSSEEISYPPLPPSPVSHSEADDEELTERGTTEHDDSASESSTSERYEESPEDLHSGALTSTPQPPPSIYTTMSDSVIASALNKATEIIKLNGPNNWVEWNRRLRGHLGVVGLWKTLTGETPAPATGTPEYIAWEGNQDKLASLLLLITGPSALSLVELDINKTATEQYKILKEAYNTTTIVTLGILYRRIFQCSLTNHKSLREYGEEVASARNKLKELGEPLDELVVSSAFLNGLDASYQAWKHMFYGGYAKNPTKEVNGRKVLIKPTTEEILLLIDIESDTSQTAAKEKSSSTRAFGAKGKKESSKTSNGNNSSKTSTSKPARHCDTCFSNRHNASHCWYIHPEKQSEEFKAKYPDAEAVRKALEKVQKTNKEWKKAHNTKSFPGAPK